MGKRLWMTVSFGSYALLMVLALALFGTLGMGWPAVLVFAAFASWLQGMVGRCFDRARPTALLTGGVGLWALLMGVAWLGTVGPFGTRLDDERYGRQTAVAYAAWLREHGHRDAVVSRCVPLRTGLEDYGPPGYYSCVIDSRPHCLLRYRGFDDFGAMSAARCGYLTND